MLLFVLSLCGFASAMSGRIVDPVVTEIAADLVAPIGVVALLSTAYTLPFALSQPLLGPLGDVFAKGRVIKVGTIMLALLLAVAAVVPTLATLFIARVFAGIAGAAILPISFALIGDLFPMAQRQLAISRFLAATLIGQVVGATASGALSHAVGWRTAFWAAAAVTGVVALAALWRLPESGPQRETRMSFGTALANYASVFRNPRASVCFSAVFVEGAVIYGWLPYIGEFFRMRGLGGAREAGIVISGLAIGGICYTALVPALLRRFSRSQMMAIAGAIAATGLICVSSGAVWSAEWAFMGVTGFGFFMLHNPIQTEVSELAPEARASAFSMHSFSFYCGQALGPVLYGVASNTIGLPASLFVGAGCFLATGLATSRLLRS